MTDTNLTDASPANGSTLPLPPILRRLLKIASPLFFIGSLGIAALVLWRQGATDEVGQAVRNADLATIILGFVLYLVGLALLCLRWDLLARLVNGVSDLPRASEAFLTSVVVNYYAPAKLAIPTRAALTMRALGLTKTQTAAVALWEMLVDLIVLAVGTLIWLATVRGATNAVRSTGNRVLEAVIGFALIGLLVVIGALVVMRLRPTLGTKIRRALNETMRYPLHQPRQAIQVTLVTVLFWIIQGGVMWVLLGALGDSRPLGLVLGLVTFPILFGMLSPLPGGTGVREALMVAVAGVHDADAGLVLVAAVVYRIALFAAIPVLYLVVKTWLAVRHRTPEDSASTEAHLPIGKQQVGNETVWNKGRETS